MKILPNHRKVFLQNNILIGNTKYHNWNIKDVPFKYLKWLAHSQYCDDNIREYYLSQINLKTKSVCIHCNEEKELSEMVPPQKSWNIEGLTQNSNVCQNCYDRRLAITSIQNISKALDQGDICIYTIPESFIQSKMSITKLRRIINQKSK